MRHRPGVVVDTGLASLLFCHLIAYVGPSDAIAVTVLVPLFAVFWGRVFLGEVLALEMGVRCFKI